MRKYTFRVYPKGRSREADAVIEIAGNATLNDLSSLILDSFYFDHDHMFEFCMDNKIYNRYRKGDKYVSGPKDEWGDPSTDTKIYRLNLVKGQNFLFHYDFGDDWQFTVHVNKIEKTDDRVIAKTIRTKGHLEQYPDWDEEEEW